MSDFRTILLHLDAKPISRERLLRLKGLAAAQQANIEALYAVMPWTQYPFVGMDVAGATATQFARLEIEVGEGIRTAFERECAAAGIENVAWQQTNDDAVQGLRQHAWAADLLVLSQHNPHAEVPSGVRSDFVANVLIQTGKPGLVLPYAGDESAIGRNVLVAWKPTPESARALAAALPILQRADKVQIISWDELEDRGKHLVQPAVEFLRRHDVIASPLDGGRPDRDLGSLLLSRADDLGADLLVMGCYGHGRAVEWVLGGVTRTVLQSMTLPVFMVH